MKFTQLFSKTQKEAPADEQAKNAQLLIKAGYVYKEMAGVYAYLPLGIRVLEKIKQIVREEMNMIGGQEFIMTTLQRKELWEKTNRWDDEMVDIWFKTKLKSDVEVGLAWSHEEPIADMMRSYIHSYKDLPVYVYQFQTKLRNELRSKSGIMRGREFVMKDSYSMCSGEAQHNEIYEASKQVYLRIFERMGIGDKTYVTFASGGAFTEYSHEFQTICDAGEDVCYINRERHLAINEEVLNDKTLAELGVKREDLEEVKTVEVGNIFNFGVSKSKSIGLNYKNEAGEDIPVWLGSYGIGITRLMGVIAEIMSDERGLVWPASISPYQVHLVGLDLHEAETKIKAEELYKTFTDQGIEVLFDDREEARAGEKFSDADLMGISLRAVVSKRSGEQIEVKRRDNAEAEMMSVESLLKRLQTK